MANFYKYFTKVVKYLLSKPGININLITLQGTASHIAVKIDNVEIINHLMRYNPNTKFFILILILQIILYSLNFSVLDKKGKKPWDYHYSQSAKLDLSKEKSTKHKSSDIPVKFL